jgi:hypothetical protein
MSRRVILAAARASADRGSIASCLAWPEFLKRWNDGQWPEFLVRGIHIG